MSREESGTGRDGPLLRLARLARQRTEAGAPPLFLDQTTREALLAALGEAARHRATAKGALENPTSASPGRVRPDAPDSPDSPGLGGAQASDEATDLSELGYSELEAVARVCTRCRLAEGRQQVVFSDGNPDARLVVVGEAPGANEDRTGLPFVGQAGQLLDLMLASVDLSRKDSVYICNVIKCRPPGNRNPQADEIASCTPFLRRQLELVSPQALLAVGTFAAQFLTGTNQALGKLRGRVHSYQGVPVVVTYHPAALLRNAGWVQPTWDDLQLLRRVMG